MRLSRFVYRGVGLACFVLAVVVTPVMAGSTAHCDFSRCTITNLCGSPGNGPSGRACIVKVSEVTTSNGSLVTNVTPDIICVRPNTEILWYTLEPNSEFTVTFGSHPFPSTSSGTFPGKKGQPSGDTAGGNSACYQYSAVHRINGKAAQVDPKVIVDGGRHPDKQQAPKKPIKR